MQPQAVQSRNTQSQQSQKNSPKSSTVDCAKNPKKISQNRLEQKCGRILVLSGPSGAGKSTLCAALKESIGDMYFSISTTTRAMRDGERDGEHYHFVSEREFIADIEKGEFLEWAQVHNHYYGTSLKPIQKALSQGKLVVLDVDVQGHRSIKEHYGELAKSIFVTTKSKQILRERLEKRQSDSKEHIELRLLHAYNEMQHISQFDYVIINDDIAQAKSAILHIATSLEFLTQETITDLLMQEWKG